MTAVNYVTKTGVAPSARECPRCGRRVGGFFALDRFQPARHRDAHGAWCRQLREPGSGRVIAPAAKREPTDRQREVLAFLADYVRERGGAPSMREIGSAFGITSTNGVNDHLIALERKGLIDRDPLVSRGLRVTASGFVALGVSPCRHCGGTGRAS